MILVDLARGTFVSTRANFDRLISIDDEQDREKIVSQKFAFFLVTRKDLKGGFNGNSDEFSIV